MQTKLAERSVGSKGMMSTKLTIVPADPNEEIPMKKGAAAAATTADGKQAKENKNEDLKNALKSEKAAGVGYWLPRHAMVKLMAECIDEHNALRGTCKIDLLCGQECVSILPTRKVNANNVVIVTAKDVDGSLKLHQATLVVGADGMNSKVRQCIATSPTNIWEGGLDPKKFELKQWTSPASHLRIKVLQLPPRFEIPNANGKPPLTSTSEEIYALRSVKTGPRNYLSLGLLPMKDNNAVRPTNIVTRPDHEVWDIHDGPAMQAYFQEAYPRFDFVSDKLISAQEWERFAKAKGTKFPHCQYSEGLAVWDGTGTCGVALVGDACHAFPPDIGQGVNAGLCDVVSLDRALKGLNTETGKVVASSDGKRTASLQKNLERYQQQHAPENAALIRLARFGAPYQYKQPHRADRVLLKLWTLNVAVRLILSKLTFGLVPPSSIILSQNEKLTYRQVMRRADLTTAVFKAIFLGVFGLLMKQRFGFGFLKALFA